MAEVQQYLKKAVKVTCIDNRVLYGLLVCVSCPFSIILQHAVSTHPSPLDLDLDYHYMPHFPAKYFTHDESISQAYERYDKATDPAEQALLLEKVEEARKFNDEFMKGKYMIASVAIPGPHIVSIVLI